MAITSNGTRNLLKANQLPTGYTLPTVTIFTDFEYTKTLNLTMLKSDIALATPVLTMANLIDDALVGIDKQVLDAITSDFVSTKSVVYFTDLRTLTSTDALSGGDDSWLTNASTSYNAKVIVYIKSV